jgi:hypothetical protein
MGLFSRLRGNHEDDKADAAAANAPPSRSMGSAPYDPGLIPTLTGDHRELQRTLVAIKTAAGESRFGDIAHLLAHFRQIFQTHIAAENGRFYPHLLQRVARDREAAELIGQARRELNDLGFQVLKFVDAYTAVPPTHLTEQQFKYELEEATARLAQRVQKVEARLYALYRP